MSVPLSTSTSEHSYTILDWLEAHDLDRIFTIETVAEIRPIANPNAYELAPVPLNITANEAWEIAAESLARFSPELSNEIKWLEQFCEKNLQADANQQPSTSDLGRDKPPSVSLSYQGAPEDVLCIAHEFGHALQYHLAKGKFIPPVLREFAAFISERAFLKFIREYRNDLYKQMHSAWQRDNQIYFGDDTENLSNALKSTQSPYTYRMNYPLARLLSYTAFSAIPEADRPRIFRGSIPLWECFRFQQNNGSEKMRNYLPNMPEADKDRPAVNAYCALGAMALLDIDYWQGESEKSIEEYYSARLGHMQTQTAFVAIDSDRKPIGYAIWEPDPNDAKIVRLKRQAAPFGDHMELQEKLQAWLPENVTALSHHSRSAREEQVAW